MSGGKRRGRLAALVLLAPMLVFLLPAPAAKADFHLMSIREIYPGDNNNSYVMLQMYSPAQTNLNGHQIVLYGPSGSATTTFTFSGGVSNGANQATVLVADTGYPGGLPSAPAADRTHAALDIPTGGGAVCFVTVDCVAWGNFTGSLNPGVGSPASPGGITSGMAIRRTITGGSCTNQLDVQDDTNNSAADFTEQTPHPRANGSSIEEGTTCTAPAQVDTTIGAKPATRTNSTSAIFSFSGSPFDPGMNYQCRLDNELDFTSCLTPKEYTGLTGGAGTSHTFRVRAVHPTMGTDTTPASYTWTIDTVAPTTTITKQPPDPSPGGSAAFNFTATETAAFQCKLEGPKPSTLSSCSSGKTYTALPNGEYTFSVHATDTAGNEGEPDSYAWTVDNSLADTTPPETTILTKPSDPSDTPNAAFTYSSNEPNSTFECKLDSAGFESCPISGTTVEGLAAGAHTFQVRAKDSSGNIDPTPAGYSWSVVLPSAPLPLSPPLASQDPAPPPASGAPDTTITLKPRAVTRDRTPTFRFRSNVGGARYQCKVDRGTFRACRSPFTTKLLRFGRHSVQVRAVVGGQVDPTPARSSFKVVKGTKLKRKRRGTRRASA